MVTSLSSCTYEPTGSHFVNIELEEPKAYITFNQFQDTLKLFGDVFLQASVDIGDRSLSSVSYSINDVVIEESNQIERFRLKTLEYSNGYHKFSMEIIANSGTGSLADNFNVEKAIFKKDWVLFIDNSAMQSSKIINVYPHNGNLKIDWERNNQIHFSHYRISINDTYNEKLIFENRNTTSCIYNGYVGGEREFKVIISGYGSGTAGPTYYYNSSENLRSNSVDNTDGSVTLIWNKNPFYNNFNKYSLSKLADNYYNSINLFESENINDTIFIDDEPLFGNKYKYHLNTYSNDGFSNSTEFEFEFGEKITEFNGIKIVEENKSIYLRTFTKLLRLDWDTFEVKAELNIENLGFNNMRYSVSNNGTYFYIANNKKIYRVDPYSLTIQASIELTALFNEDTFVNGTFFVNNNNQILFEKAYTSDERTYYYKGIAILDMNSSEIIFKLSKDDARQSNNLITDDGEFLLNGFNLYQRLNGEFTKINESRIYWAKLCGSNNTFLGLDAVSSKSLNIYSAENLNLLTTLSIDEDISSFEYVQEDQYITIRSNENFYIYNFNTFDLLHKINILDANIYYANDYLISSEGYFTSLQSVL